MLQLSQTNQSKARRAQQNCGASAASAAINGDNDSPTNRHASMHTLLFLTFLLLAPILPLSAAQLALQQGDLLFVTSGSAGLSRAIDEATAREGAPSYDHVALLVNDDGQPAVLHADEKGSRQQPLAEFLSEARNKQRQVVAYRLIPAQRHTISDAIRAARQMLGKPYNHTYVQDENSYYCSDFIERAFRSHHVFALQPMNFKNPQTSDFPAYWQDFYRSRNMPVPQDMPGTNPNDMAQSAILERIGSVN